MDEQVTATHLDETLREFVGYQIKRAFNVIRADLSGVLKPFGLRMTTFSALVLIVDNPGLRQSQLAEALDIERPNLVVIVDELEQRGLITRARIPQDRRAFALKATVPGRRACEKALAAIRAHEERIMAGIGSAAREEVIAVMQRIEAYEGRPRDEEDIAVPAARRRPHGPARR